MPNAGKIKQIIGAVVDVQFDGQTSGDLQCPGIEKARWRNAGAWKYSSIWEKTAFVVLPWMVPKDLIRGLEVLDTGIAISMPVGDAIKGRLFNVTGDPIDGLPPVSKCERKTDSQQTPCI